MDQEKTVIQQVLRGDIDSFRLLVERYQGPVIRIVKNIIEDNHICEDIAQDVFFTAYKKLGTFDSARSNFSTWLFTIARNKSINAIKKKKTLSLSKLPEKLDSCNPSEALSEKELFDKLDEVLQSLASRYERALVLAEFEKLSYQEIAQIEGVRIGTIKSRINRAKKKLFSALKDFEAEL
ncbi:RNA polymerase sigma factor [Planctomycetota bacterium]